MRTYVGSRKRRLGVFAAGFAAVSTLATVDLIADLHEGTTVGHVLIEGFILLFGLVGLSLLAVRFVRLHRREREARAAAESLARDLEHTRRDAERWRTEASDLLAGLGALIDQQLGTWGLTRAEQESAKLLLKGFSHKEVAQLRGVSVTTARQQATAVYRKAGVSGRHDLAAFFLEDLLAPRTNGAVDG